jgi:hypothetical protein
MTDFDLGPSRFKQLMQGYEDAKNIGDLDRMQEFSLDLFREFNFDVNYGQEEIESMRDGGYKGDSGKLTDKDIQYQALLRFNSGKLTDKDIQGLASLGRFGDTYMVHAHEGETFIPQEILDDNPELREDIHEQMRSMGIDPARYTVGNALNSINPNTGQPEFFFKKIGKMLKKAAPIIGSVVGFAVGGPAGAAIGSGLGSLAGGKSAEEAILNAGLSYMGGKYLTPSVSKGLQSAGVGTGTLGSAIGSSGTGQIANQPLADIIAAGGTALLTDQTTKGLGSMFDTPQGEALDPNDYLSVVDQYYADLAAGLNPEVPPQLAVPPQEQLIQPLTMADVNKMNFSSATPIDYSYAPSITYEEMLKRSQPAGILGAAGGGYIPDLRGGGYFRGIGGPRDDANLTRLSDTEYVMKSNAVAGADPTGQNNPDKGALIMDGIMAYFDNKANQNERYA